MASSSSPNNISPPPCVHSRILLIKNYPSASPADHLMLESFQQNIQRSAPTAELDICCVANGEPIPADLSHYRLIILSGGKVNLIAEDRDEVPKWAIDVLEMVRRIVGEKAMPKLLGICWGHQAIHHALGGELAWVEQGALVGVQDVNLTPEGQKMFKQESLRIQKYHVRYVKSVAPTFVPLAERNEIAMSKSGRILTFQGHPEMTAEISRLLSGKDDGTYTKSSKSTPTEAARDGNKIFIDDVETPHDGESIWGEIMGWAVD